MPISYNTGTTGSATNIPAATAFTFTVPAGIAVGETMFVSLNVFSFTANTFGMSTPSSGGGSWTQIGTTQVGSQGSIGEWASAWWRVATASDPGSTFTVSWTGTTGGGNQFWWSADLESYPGADTSGPIGNFAWSVANSAVTTATGPTTTTTRANSWAIQANPVAVSSSGSITGEPATNRHVINPGAGVDNAVSDSNGSVGASGTTIGGGTWTWSNQTNGAGIMFTCELLAPAAGTPGSPVQPRVTIPVPSRRRRSLIVIPGLISATGPVFIARPAVIPRPRPRPRAVVAAPRGLLASPPPVTPGGPVLVAPLPLRPRPRGRSLVITPRSLLASPPFTPGKPVLAAPLPLRPRPRGRAAVMLPRPLLASPVTPPPRGQPSRAPDDKSYLKKLIMLS